MSDLDLDAIQARCDAATTKAPVERYWCNLGGSYPLYAENERQIGNVISDTDGDFIAAAFADLPRCLAYIRELQARLAACERERDALELERDSILAAYNTLCRRCGIEEIRL